MKKFSVKLKILISLILVVVLAFSYTIVTLYNQKIYWQERTAQLNISKWHHLQQMALTIDRIGYNETTFEEHCLYINAKIYSNAEDITPAFNGDGKAHAFLQSYYDQLAKDLASKNKFVDGKEEALKLFEEINKEFLTLCNDIIASANNSDKERIQLMDNDSELYKTTEKKITDFCNRYAEKISILNSKYH